MSRNLKQRHRLTTLLPIPLAFCLSASAISPSALQAAPTSSSAGAKHHLIMFTLTRENTVFPGIDPGRRATPGASFKLRDGGQFEVEIVKSAFPVPAPSCRSYIILRMPWTNPTIPRAKTDIEEKHALFAQLDQLRRRQISQVPVAIDLDPYVREISSSGLELTACNVFFHDVDGRYVGSVESP